MEQMDRYEHPLALFEDRPVVDKFDGFVKRESLVKESLFRDMLLSRFPEFSAWCAELEDGDEAGEAQIIPVG